MKNRLDVREAGSTLLKLSSGLAQSGMRAKEVENEVVEQMADHLAGDRAGNHR
jgi:hypothetical protein